MHVFSQKKDFTFKISSSRAFKEFAGKPLTHAFSGVSSIKLVYHLTENKLYFINSKKYPLHYNFCKEFFENMEMNDFNHLNYNDNPSRQYYLATLNCFKDANIYTLEFSPADNISKEAVEMIYSGLQKAFFSSNLFLQLNTQTRLKYTDWQIPIISMSDLFAGQKLQIIQKGKANGKLIIVDADSLKSLGKVNDCILLIRGNANEIPLCRAIITTSFQTPLSHIAILSQNRKTPLIALKDAASEKLIRFYVNKDIIFNVLEDTFLIEENTNVATAGNISSHKQIKLLFDTITQTVVPVKNLRIKDIKTYGVKAVNFGQLQQVKYKGKRIMTPEGGFAIPMFYYYRHLKKNGADTLINHFLTNYQSMSKVDIQYALSHIQSSIENGKINKELLKIIEKNIFLSGKTGRFRFRSSSNAEDLEGFNGAGLYTSETGNNSKSIEKAIEKVWSSLWSERAFEERCNAGIDHRTAGMAVLAHRSFPAEYANGVAITRNMYRDFDFGFVINLQIGDNSLVKPSGEETCEQFISYFNSGDSFFNGKDAIEYLSFSSLNDYQPILTKTEIFELTQQLDKIKRRFYRKLKAWKKYTYKDFAMDVEFKAELTGGKKVFYFKQARPFN